MSQLEEHISSILRVNHIKFEREYQFRDLRNGLYRFDFYIPDLGAACEVNGIQHYMYSSHFYNSKSDFSKAQERDRRKIAYCLAHNIKLYIIPYWDIDNIRTSNDIFQEKYLARTKFHNDEVYRIHFSKTT